MLAGRGLAAVEQAHPGLPGGWCVLAAGLAEHAGAATRAPADNRSAPLRRSVTMVQLAEARP